MCAGVRVSIVGWLLLAAFIADAGSLSGRVEAIDGNGRPAFNPSVFVVFLEGQNERSAMSLRVSGREVTQYVSHKGKQFQPRVLPIEKDSTVDFLNDDGIFHNAFSLSRVKTFDLGIYPEGTSKLVRFETTGMVKVYCNIHPDMVTSILVLDNPFFTTTSAEGRYAIHGIPDGQYLLRVWGEHSEESNHSVSVRGDAGIAEDFRVRVAPAIERHRNKFGKPYRTKY